ncbi:MAG: hypothetical protein AB7E51_15090 [Pseudodesulfovibrio sp.]|uniref:hypothetical protein n=1 Tax=Pseudodesulfovibrio sp. TaxID=2035812 RepID=UPI003D0C2744
MANRTKWTEKKRAEFLEALRETGTVTKSAKAVSFSTTRLYELRAEDETFRAEWDAAQKVGEKSLLESMEREADRRAMKGTCKAVFHKGKPCGFVREYSDTLLMFRMKKLDPRYAKQVIAGDAENPLRTHLKVEFVNPEGDTDER